MTSYLLVALLACGVIEHIHGLDDGISAEFAFDVQKRLLHMQFGVPSWRILGTTIGGTHSLAFGRISGSGIHRRFHRGEQSCSSVSTSAATTFSRRTSKRLSTIERKSLSTASQIRDVADVGSGNAIDPVAGLGTRRPYLSIETGPSYVATACSAIAFKSAEPSLPSRFGSRLAVS